MANRTTRPIVPIEHGNEREHRRLLAFRANAALPKDGTEGMSAPLALESYSTAGLPTASLWKGALAYNSDLNAAVYSDGISWISVANPLQAFTYAIGDEVTAITAATNKIRFRMPYAFTLSAIRASLSVAQTAGVIFTVNVKMNAVTILSTLLTIDNNELTSVTAATPPVISVPALTDDAAMSVDVTQIGTSGAAGLKLYLIGRRT